MFRYVHDMTLVIGSSGFEPPSHLRHSLAPLRQICGALWTSGAAPCLDIVDRQPIEQYHALRDQGLIVGPVPRRERGQGTRF
jgi:hypothetical protein